MILRILRARVKPGKHATYVRLCRDKAIPLMHAQPGFVAARIAPYRAAYPQDFSLISVWTNRESIAAWLGERWEEAMILPGEADLLESISIEHTDESFKSVTQMRRALAARVAHLEHLALLDERLTDMQWERIRRELPERHREGRPRSDDRRTLDGILYVLRAGCRWHDMPRQFGSPVTCWRRLHQWETDGTWATLWQTYVGTLDAHGKRLWSRIRLDATMPPQHARRSPLPTGSAAGEPQFVEPTPTGSEASASVPMVR